MIFVAIHTGSIQMGDDVYLFACSAHNLFMFKFPTSLKVFFFFARSVFLEPETSPTSFQCWCELFQILQSLLREKLITLKNLSSPCMLMFMHGLYLLSRSEYSTTNTEQNV